MDTIFDIVDGNNLVVGSFAGEKYSDARAYAASLDPTYLVGSHGEPGGPGPTREVPSDLLEAIFTEHGQASEHSKSPAVAALKTFLRNPNGNG